MTKSIALLIILVSASPSYAESIEMGGPGYAHAINTTLNETFDSQESFSKHFVENFIGNATGGISNGTLEMFASQQGGEPISAARFALARHFFLHESFELSVELCIGGDSVGGFVTGLELAAPGIPPVS